MDIVDNSRFDHSIYCAILLTDSGAVHNVTRFLAGDDERAIEQARKMVDGHAVELWNGLRFIDHFTPNK